MAKKSKKKATRKKAARNKRDIEKAYPTRQFIQKLRRLADALEQGKSFRIQIAGERVYIPARAVINLEHERSSDSEEVEFQMTWDLEK